MFSQCNAGFGTVGGGAAQALLPSRRQRRLVSLALFGTTCDERHLCAFGATRIFAPKLAMKHLSPVRDASRFQ